MSCGGTEIHGSHLGWRSTIGRSTASFHGDSYLLFYTKIVHYSQSRKSDMKQDSHMTYSRTLFLFFFPVRCENDIFMKIMS